MSAYNLSEYWHETVKENPLLHVRFENVIQGAESTFPVHWHEYWEFLCIVSGGMKAVIQGRTYTLKPGDILVVNSEELHMTITETGTNYLLLQINKKYFASLTADIHSLRFNNFISDDDECYKLFYNLFIINDKAENGYPFLFTSKLYEFFYYIYTHHLSESVGDFTDIKERSKMTELLEWIKENCMEDLNLNMAAEHLHVSREYFCRLFRRYTGQTFLEYLYSIRTMAFYESLKTSDDSIPLLMEKSHLSNYKVFIRTFKKIYGKTPQSIRKTL